MPCNFLALEPPTFKSKITFQLLKSTWGGLMMPKLLQTEFKSKAWTLNTYLMGYVVYACKYDLNADTASVCK